MGGKPSLALSAFVRAQGLQPDCLDYVLNGVDVTEEAGETDAELARLTVACDQNPLNLALQIGRGMLLERIGRRESAIEALEAATELAPDQVAPLRLLANILASSSRTRQAEVVLRRLIAMDPDSMRRQTPLLRC